MRRGGLWSVAAAAVTVVSSASPLVSCGDGDGEAVDVAARAPAPAYAAVDLATGADATLAGLRGEVVLLAGWATWCLPCERELPELQAYAADAPDGLRIVAVNVDDAGTDDAAVEAMTSRLGVSLPVWRDPAATLLESFGGFAMPFSVLVDPEGRIVRTWNGALDVDDPIFTDAITAALA